MSIISHNVIITPQSGTRDNVVYEFTDHIGGVTVVNKLLPYAFDTDADALSMYPQIEEHLAEKEGASGETMVERGLDVLSYVQAVDHTTTKIVVKRIIRRMMRERNPYMVIVLEPLIIYLRANYTNAQLMTFLDITAGQATKLNTRINAILDNRTFLDTFDTNAEEIE